ncbi:hypothetical protein BDW59DRAFT_166272 [Aspergillus cavernicola]|uniref:Uncharacterized protein n=1 Tax=Aspergillus cavernicola TaxID=176166 RepID=A0ABR4HPH6_9EURO
MYHTALILAKVQEKPGVYSVGQLANGKHPLLASFSQSKTRERFELAIDAFYIGGWVDTLTSEIIIELETCGFDLGVFHGIANQTLRIDIDLHFVKGTVRLELNPFDEIWVHFDTVQGGKDSSFCTSKFKKSMHLHTLPNLACEPWL